MKSVFHLLLTLALVSSATGRANESTWPDPAQIERFVADMQRKHGHNADELRRMLAAVRPDPQVLQAIAPPANPNVKSWQRYRARFINAQRIRGGLAFWQTHDAALRRAEREFGVPASIIVAIIGVETEYGRNTGHFEAFEALATLAFAYPPRADFFRGELEELLLLARENGLVVRELRSSFAGALGIPQFMPGSQRKLAVDFDHDGRIDLMNSPDDAIGSIANFLREHGWQGGEPVADPVAGEAPARPDWLALGLKPSLDEAALALAGYAGARAPVRFPVALIDLVTPEQGAEYWWAYGNFYVITRYNRSSFYAMSVFQLASALERERQLGGRSTSVKAGYRAPRRRAG